MDIKNEVKELNDEEFEGVCRIVNILNEMQWYNGIIDDLNAAIFERADADLEELG